VNKSLEYVTISSRGQPTLGGPPAWVLGGGLTTLPRKTVKLNICYESLRTASEQVGLLGTT
jgi:hypothetical protein